MLQGDSRNLPLQGLVQSLDLNRQQGTLTVRCGRIERSFALIGRSLTPITSSDRRNSVLPDALARLRILETEEYQNVLESLGNPTAPGDALIECQLLEREHAVGPLRTLLLEGVHEVFEWQAAHYSFEAGEVDRTRFLFNDPQIESALAFAVPSILMEVARREDEWARIRNTIPSRHQIYRLDCSEEAYNAIAENEIDTAGQREQIRRLLEEPRPLSSLIEEAPAAAFHLLLAVRNLIEDGHLQALTISEKEDLAERLRNKRQNGRLAAIYRSLLEDDADNHEITRRLVLLLEQRKVPHPELAELHHRLACHHGESGDQESELRSLRRRAEILVDDLDAQANLLIAVDAAGSRNEARSLRARIVEMGLQENPAVAAEAIEKTCDPGRREDLPWLEKCSELWVAADEPERAAALLRKVLEGSSNAGLPLAVLRRLARRLEAFDDKGAARWLLTADRKHRTDSERNRSLLVIGAVVLLGIAFASRGPTPSEAEASPTSPPPPSLATTPPPTHSPVQRFTAEIDIDRLVSKGLGLKKEGKYQAALDHFSTIDRSRLGPQVAHQVLQEAEKLQRYISSARSLFEQATALEVNGRIIEASRTYRRLLSEYPHSPTTAGLMVPVVLNPYPADAKVLIDGKPARVEKGILSVPAEKSVGIEVSRSGFENAREVIDARTGSRIDVFLQKIPERTISIGAQVDARPLLAGNLVITGSRNGSIEAHRISDGKLDWRHQLDGIGDALGGITRIGDRIVVVTSDAHIYSLSLKTGEPIAVRSLGEGRGLCRIAPVPNLLAASLLLVTSRGWVISLDNEDLSQEWAFAVGAIGEVAPVTTTEGVAVATSSGDILILDSSSGEERWRLPVGERVSALTSSGGQLLFGTHRGRIAACSVGSGKINWTSQLETSVSSIVEISRENFVATTVRGNLSAMVVESGKILWKRMGLSSGGTAPLLHQGILFCATADGRLNALSPRLGEVLWTFRSEGPLTAPVAAARGRVLVCDGQRRAHLLSLQLPDGGQQL